MLRNRSRAVTSKQALMADHTSLPSSTKYPSAQISSFLGSPRFFNGFSAKNSSNTETSVTSPTSILDIKTSSSVVSPFGYDRNKSKSASAETNCLTNKQEPEAIGLALIDSIVEEKDDGNDRNFSKPINRMALLGSKLKVQIPVLNPPSSLSPMESPKSPADFGIKTRSSQLPSPLCGTPTKDLNKQLSLKEMELSEDYTCVTTHGPNPKTTHIYDDCIVESCCGDDTKFSDHRITKESSFDTGDSNSPAADFLSSRHACKGILGQGKDIYMSGEERGFCSHECCSQEMF